MHGLNVRGTFTHNKAADLCLMEAYIESVFVEVIQCDGAKDLVGYPTRSLDESMTNQWQ